MTYDGCRKEGISLYLRSISIVDTACFLMCRPECIPIHDLSLFDLRLRGVYERPEQEEAKLPFGAMPDHGLVVLPSEILRSQAEPRLDGHLHLLYGVQ
jgi:hypothetical protein